MEPSSKNRILNVAPLERRKETRMRILQLMEGYGWTSWGDLYKRAKSLHIGRATLSRHLKELIRLGLIERRVDTSKYPPRTFYREKMNESVFVLFTQLSKRCKKAWEGAKSPEEQLILLDAFENLMRIGRFLNIYSKIIARRIDVEFLDKEFEIREEIFLSLSEPLKNKIRRWVKNNLQLDFDPSPDLAADVFPFEEEFTSLLEGATEEDIKEIKEAISKFFQKLREAREREVKKRELNIKETEEGIEELEKIIEDRMREILESMTSSLKTEELIEKAPFISEKISSIVEEIENELEKLEGKVQKKNKWGNPFCLQL